MAKYLRGTQITEVYTVGLAADYCVYYIAKDALKEGFTTYVIKDAVRATINQGFDKAKADLIDKGRKIIESSSIL